MKFTSTRFPQLVVNDLDAAFVDGEVDVTDKATADTLKSLPAALGVRQAAGPQTPVALLLSPEKRRPYT
ncbi:hypothetical protein [Actinocrispum sp. NPDC049592]|uniref:hypothetical protein n=1 Tax=Actinocrispum sp. NPDC049592 TaxID=3154835 RepID=UPI0034248112